MKAWSELDEKEKRAIEVYVPERLQEVTDSSAQELAERFYRGMISLNDFIEGKNNDKDIQTSTS